MNNARNKRLVTLVSCAMLVAIEIVLSRFLSISTPIARIGFDFAPLALAGMLFGPWYGCAVGALADLLGATLFPQGAPFPGFTLVAGLCGMTYGLLLHQKDGVRWSRGALLVRIAVAAVITNLCLELVINTYWLSILMDKGYLAMLPARVVKNLAMVPVEFVVINAMRMALVDPLTRRTRVLTQ